MRQRYLGSVLTAVVLAMLGTTTPAWTDDYNVDPIHSSVTFKISHLGLGWVHGRFNTFSGSFTIDPDDAAKCMFEMTVNTDSVDTNNKQRDTHLRSPDFFNAKQFPSMTFKATSVKAIKNGYEVTGDFTMHGETKPVTLALVGGRTAEFPKGFPRTGYSTELVLKRSDFGVGSEKFSGALGDEVHIAVSFEGTKKR
jgi:polyisoprenoid-binding protein YceI